ncbi:hypothetical protein FRX31_017356, partial [Thalictrum thalictroides]
KEGKKEMISFFLCRIFSGRAGASTIAWELVVWVNSIRLNEASSNGGKEEWVCGLLSLVQFSIRFESTSFLQERPRSGDLELVRMEKKNEETKPNTEMY